jgi:hypothetical protein
VRNRIVELIGGPYHGSYAQDIRPDQKQILLGITTLRFNPNGGPATAPGLARYDIANYGSAQYEEEWYA